MIHRQGDAPIPALYLLRCERAVQRLALWLCGSGVAHSQALARARVMARASGRERATAAPAEPRRNVSVAERQYQRSASWPVMSAVRAYSAIRNRYATN